MEKKYSIYKKTIIVISLIVFFISFIAEKTEGYKYMMFIPLAYFFSSIFFKKIHEYSRKYKGMMLLNLIMFVKYVIAIFLICIFKNYNLSHIYKIYVSNESYHIATFYLIIEMISIFITIELFSDFFYNKDAKNRIDIKKYKYIKIGPILVIFILIALVLLLKYRTFFVSNVLDIMYNRVTDSTQDNNILNVIFYAFKFLLMGISINYLIVRFQETNKKKYILLTYFIIIIHSFLSISTSRLNMVLPFLIFMYITGSVFKKKSSILNIICIIIILISFSVVSKYKNPWIYSEESNVGEDLVEFSTGIQEYTSNILPTAIGLQAISVYRKEISLVTLFNDIAGSIPLVSHYINQNNRIYRLYNLYALNGKSMSQLIPMTVSSIAYFTRLFCWVLITFNIVVLMYLDGKMKENTDNYLEEHLKIYLLFVFASSLYSNVQMLSGRIFVNFLPVYILILLNKKIVFKNTVMGEKNEE